MDVSCPRCKTEYEFDDARVPDSGVTVKCTSCNHVFRVRKKSAPTATTSQPALSLEKLEKLEKLDPRGPKVGDETLPARSPLMAQPATREWKVRQPSGNIFSFKELTTLQKWIVERKVSRDDEISLTGEAWKRLGNIAELASFFQIVDDAKKVHELEALQQMKEKLSTKPDAEPAPKPPPPPPAAIEDSAPRSAHQSGAVPAPGERAGLMQMPAYEGTPPAPRPRPHEAPTLPPTDEQSGVVAKKPVSKQLTETLREPGFVSLPPRGPVERPQYRPPPLPMHEKRSVIVEEETMKPKGSGGGAGMWIGILLVIAGVGGAAGWYFVVYEPQQRAAQIQKDLELEKAKAAADKQKEEDAAKEAERVKAEAEKKAVEDAEKKKQDEEAGKKAAVTVDAGTAAVAVKNPETSGAGGGAGTVGAGGAAGSGEKKEPKRNADYYINLGDKMRDKDRAEAALDAYGKALDLAPDNVEALTGKGLCYLDMAKPMQAEPLLEQALKQNPRYAPAIMGLAESYRFQGKKESAISMYQKYLDSFPNGPEAGVAKANIERLK